jgi:hypothetical protein
LDYNLKVVWITTSDSVENAYLLHSDVILQIQARWITNASYWECLLVYVDDLLVIGLNQRATIKTLEMDHNFVLKDFGPPAHYLGASIGTYTIDDNTQLKFFHGT